MGGGARTSAAQLLGGKIHGGGADAADAGNHGQSPDRHGQL